MPKWGIFADSITKHIVIDAKHIGEALNKFLEIFPNSSRVEAYQLEKNEYYSNLKCPNCLSEDLEFLEVELLSSFHRNFDNWRCLKCKTEFKYKNDDFGRCDYKDVRLN